MSRIRFDHAIVLVDDLEAGMAAFRQLGFNPIIGGVHAGAYTHNALIVFQDGSYLELLAPVRRESLFRLNPDDRSNFLFLFAKGTGWGGYALIASDLAEHTAAAQRQGVMLQLRPPGGRTRPDGAQLRWQTAAVEGSMCPFLIEDLSPRVLRVPDDPAICVQPNGAVGTTSLTVAIHPMRLVPALAQYEALLGVPPFMQSDERAVFALGDFRLVLEFMPDVEADYVIEMQLIGARSLEFDSSQTFGASLSIRSLS